MIGAKRGLQTENFVQMSTGGGNGYLDFKPSTFGDASLILRVDGNAAIDIDRSGHTAVNHLTVTGTVQVGTSGTPLTSIVKSTRPTTLALLLLAETRS